MLETIDKSVRVERERIADWLETHSIDWDCSVLVFDRSDYDEGYWDSNQTPRDEWKEKACRRRMLADVVRGKIVVIKGAK